VEFAKRLFKSIVKGGGKGKYMDWLSVKVQELFCGCGAICGRIRRGWREKREEGSIREMKQ
jgi:hypothetical protein